MDTAAVRTTIEAAVIQALGGTEQLVAVLVREALSKKVNEGSSYSSREVPWLDVVCRDVIQGTVREVVVRYFNERRGEIEAEVIRQLDENKASVASRMMEAVCKVAEESWRVDVKIRAEKKEYED